MMRDVFLIGDGPAENASTHGILKENGFTVETVLISNARQRLDEEGAKCVVSLNPSEAGLSETISILKGRNIPLIVLLPNATYDTTTYVFRAGAQDCLKMPFNPTDLVERVKHWTNGRISPSSAQPEPVTDKPTDSSIVHTHVKSTETIVGVSDHMKDLLSLVKKTGVSNSAVLILGETGTGKELIAKAVHACSKRSKGPFVAVNCCSISRELLESELFGHKKGSFTGAHIDRAGLFEAAEGGTLFLDEIGDMDLGLQAKLLRALQEKEIRRVGENKSRHVDVRIVAATNQKLSDLIYAKKFREDLFYRLNVLPLYVAPLRARPEDVPALFTYFIYKMNPNVSVDDEVVEILMNYVWKGNIRELESIVERMLVFASNDRLTRADVPDSILKYVSNLPKKLSLPTSYKSLTRELAEPAPDIAKETAPIVVNVPSELPKWQDYIVAQRTAYLERALTISGGDKSKAAAIMGCSIASLYRFLSESKSLPAAMSVTA